MLTPPGYRDTRCHKQPISGSGHRRRSSGREAELARDFGEYLLAELKYMARSELPRLAQPLLAGRAGSITGRAAAQINSSAKAFGHPKPATNWWLLRLLPQTNAPRHFGWIGQPLEAWCPIAAERREPHR